LQTFSKCVIKPNERNTVSTYSEGAHKLCGAHSYIWILAKAGRCSAKLAQVF